MAVFILILIVVWILAPTLVGHHLGSEKNRAGWAWGLFLGWFGVLIVAILSPKAAPLGVSTATVLGFSTFRPKIVTGALEAGYTYGYRRSDDIVLRQAFGSDQWVEVRDAQERAQVLASMGAAVYQSRQCPHCGEQIRVDESTCASCQGSSEPWIRKGSRWWAMQDGEWRRWDEREQRWRARLTLDAAREAAVWPKPPPRYRRPLRRARPVVAVFAGLAVAATFAAVAPRLSSPSPLLYSFNLSDLQHCAGSTPKRTCWFKDTHGTFCTASDVSVSTELCSYQALFGERVRDGALALLLAAFVGLLGVGIWIFSQMRVADRFRLASG